MRPAPRFSKSILFALHESKMLRIRAGTEHRFIGIWVVTLQGRVFVRPWNNKPGGWYQAFLEDPFGAVQIGEQEIAIRAKKARGERLSDAIDLAYGEKYHTPASRKWVRGLAHPRRRRTTLELVPA